MPDLPEKNLSPDDRDTRPSGNPGRRKRMLLVGEVILVLVLIVPLGWGYVWQPLKYRYLISRVESAKTAEEERAAFRLAADWGRVWEIDHVEAGDSEAKARGLSGNSLVKVQWLNGRVAYRSVIDRNNLQILARKKYSHGISESFL